MARFERFTFLINREERALIQALAERLRRSRSDAVRFVVIESARELGLPVQGKPVRHAAPPRAGSDATAR